MNNIVFSIIIPHRNSIETLQVLLNTIPVDNRIEVIIVDNSEEKLSVKELNLASNVKLIYSEPFRGAGGARNEGIKIAKGDWFVFADADDYFTEDAFDILFSHQNDVEEIIYFSPTAVYIGTNEPSDRTKVYSDLVKAYLSKEKNETQLRIGYQSPCSKMIRRELIATHGLLFDEVRAANDIYFSVTSGYYAKAVSADNRVVYVVTVNKGSLTMTKNYEVLKSRLTSVLKCNKFLKEHHLGSYQSPILFLLYQSFEVLTTKQRWSLIKLVFKYHQNPFLISKTSFTSYIKYLNRNRKEKKYIVK